MVLFYIAAAGAPAAAWLSNSLTVGALATHACAYWFGFSVRPRPGCFRALSVSHGYFFVRPFCMGAQGA